MNLLPPRANNLEINHRGLAQRTNSFLYDQNKQAKVIAKLARLPAQIARVARFFFHTKI